MNFSGKHDESRKKAKFKLKLRIFIWKKKPHVAIHRNSFIEFNKKQPKVPERCY